MRKIASSARKREGSQRQKDVSFSLTVGSEPIIAFSGAEIESNYWFTANSFCDIASQLAF